MSKQRPRQVHIDLDDVLVDWHAGVVAAHGLSEDRLPPPGVGGQRLDAALGMSANAFWKPLNGHDFWAGLAPTVFARDLVAVAERLAGPGNVTILSRPTLSYYSASGKLEWVHREFPHLLRATNLVVEKWRMCRPGYVLIDDSEVNIEEWVEEGGIGILVPSRSNRRHAESPCAAVAELAAVFATTEKKDDA